jgi:nucleotidyltransferase substrate binding protein (TIGR01987 family)
MVLGWGLPDKRESGPEGNAMTDVRWKQRFQNFGKALSLLENALALPAPDPVQRAGIVQFFEMSFELSWKVLKDYLEAQGLIEVKTPRSALKAAFEIGLVKDGHQWLQGLEDRNLVAHTYDESTAQQVDALIRDVYFPLFKDLAAVLEEKSRG